MLKICEEFSRKSLTNLLIKLPYIGSMLPGGQTDDKQMNSNTFTFEGIGKEWSEGGIKDFCIFNVISKHWHECYLFIASFDKEPGIKTPEELKMLKELQEDNKSKRIEVGKLQEHFKNIIRKFYH